VAKKSEDIGLIVRAISFQDFQPMWSQTDRRHAIARPPGRGQNIMFGGGGLSPGHRERGSASLYWGRPLVKCRLRT